jgi:hypothetical protein
MGVVLLSICSLAVMARWGYRILLFGGRPMAWLGAAAPLALNGIPPTMQNLQFSLICTALLLLQVELLERRRTWAAGLFWALAMLKPQIALPFALLFVRQRQWKGLAAGFCSARTDISIGRIVRYWLNGRMLNFTSGRVPLLPLNNDLLSLIDPTLLQWSVIGLAGGVMVALALCLQARATRIDLVNLSGLCSVVGALVFYHRSYDHVMLFPSLIALVRLTLLASSRSCPWITLLTIANALLLWRPNNLVLPLPLPPLQALVWGSAGLLLAWRLTTPAGRQDPSGILSP